MRIVQAAPYARHCAADSIPPRLTLSEILLGWRAERIGRCSSPLVDILILLCVALTCLLCSRVRLETEIVVLRLRRNSP